MERLLVILTLLMGFGSLVELIVGLLFHRITHKVVCVITIMGHFIGLEDFLAIIHKKKKKMVFLLCILFMVIAALNFATHFIALRRRDPGAYRRDPEARWVLLGLLAGVLLATLMVQSAGHILDSNKLSNL